MSAVSLFLPRLLPWVTGCSEPLARQSLVDAAIEFCEETQLVQEQLAPVDVTAGVGTYTLAPAADTIIVSTMKVWYGGTLLTPAPTAEIDSILAFSSGVTGLPQQMSEPRCFYELSPGVIGVYPLPAQTVASILSARIATKPTRAATTLPDLLYNDWVEAIVAGARVRIHSIPGNFFSDDTKARESDVRFRTFMNRARNISKRGRINSSMSVKPNQF